MLKRLLVTLLPFLASSCGNGPKPAGNDGTVDPRDILFTLPTLCDLAPAMEASAVPKDAKQLHEDDWRQVEFVPVSNEDHLTNELAALAAFKAEHRVGAGWKKIYLRKEFPKPLAMGGLRRASLPEFATAALVMSGQAVQGGFALTDQGEWFIYGQSSPDGHVIQLGVSPGMSPCTERFAAGLVQIARVAGLQLVDWYAGAVVDVTSSASIIEWSRRYGR